MRIEVAEHALDGIFQQGLVADGFDIGGLDAVQYLGKGAQIVQRQRSRATVGGATGRAIAGRGEQVGLVGLHQRCADQHAERQGQRGKTGRMRHVERTPEKVRVGYVPVIGCHPPYKSVFQPLTQT